jgi:hypothetical protein
MGLSFLDESISDLKSTWPISLALVFISFVVSLILLLLIRWCGGCLVISVIVGYFAVIITFAVLCLLSAEGKIKVPSFIQTNAQ